MKGIAQQDTHVVDVALILFVFLCPRYPFKANSLLSILIIILGSEQVWNYTFPYPRQAINQNQDDCMVEGSLRSCAVDLFCTVLSELYCPLQCVLFELSDLNTDVTFGDQFRLGFKISKETLDLN